MERGQKGDAKVKSQDIVLLFKIASLQNHLKPATAPDTRSPGSGEPYTLRALSASLGLSKSEVSNALARCHYTGLLMADFDTSLPRVNRRALFHIAEHALKYFFPVKIGAIVRGIPTGFSVPELSTSLQSAGELIHVWPDPSGTQRGQAITPLYKSVPAAVKQDPALYHYLALVDAIRTGGPRETSVATALLKTRLGLE